MYLIIETSSAHSLVALVHQGKIAASTIRQHSNQLSCTLLPDIQSLLHEANLPIEQLTGIYAGIGPGSYTGTRVGVAVAKTLSFALSIPLIPFCSLLAYLPDVTGSFSCVMPSRTQEIFVLKGECTEGALSICLSSLMDRAGAIQSLQGVSTLVGPEIEGIAGQWISPLPGFDSLLKWLNSYELAPTDHIQLPANLIYLHTP
jgi:tRNA threonylcarbamoyl adenosine modification protein YeaZ